jgi:hypothetical protein
MDVDDHRGVRSRHSLRLVKSRTNINLRAALDPEASIHNAARIIEA